MAHFARINEINQVVRVMVVNNSVIVDENGQDQERLGINFLTELYPNSVWVQTSYNGNFRKNYAGIGYSYDKVRDAFIPPKPYPSWLLNEDTCLWDAPVSMPDDEHKYTWNEETSNWNLIEVE
jgi:hypothetical protein